MTRGGKREGAGRKQNTVERKRHLLTFTDDEWQSMIEAAGGERKVAKYLAELHKKETKK